MATAAQVLKFVREQGAVLQSARGPLPTLTEAIAGEPIRGSWWGHPQGNLIYALLGEVDHSGQVAACRLVRGKITLVHRRLWPALYKLRPKRKGPELDRVTQEHTATGAHRSITEPWPEWVPAKERAAARKLSESRARDQLGRLAAALKA
jgi:hypothetical protein